MSKFKSLCSPALFPLLLFALSAFGNVSEYWLITIKEMFSRNYLNFWHILAPIGKLMNFVKDTIILMFEDILKKLI